MSKRWSGLRLVFAVLALAALSAVMAAACGDDDDAAKDTAPAATQAPVAQAATAAPVVAAPTTAPVMAATQAPVAMAATAAPASPAATAAPVAMATAMTMDLSQTSDVPAAVQLVLDELGLELSVPPAATTDPKHGGTMFVAGIEPLQFDQHQYPSYRLAMSHSYTHLRLLRFAAGPGQSPNAFVPIPSIAKSWDIEDGGHKFVFHLRDGVKWHAAPPGVDSVPTELAGRAVTAGDFVFAFDRLRAHEQASYNASKLSHTTSWTAPNDSTLVLENDQVVAALLVYMSQMGFEAMPPEMEALCDDYALPECSNVGNGPYMFNELNPGVSTSYVRNDDYWEAPYPYVDEVVELYFGDAIAQDAAFRTGKLDLIGTDTCSISGERYRALTESNPELTYATFPDSMNTRGIWMKQDAAPFNDVNARRAVAVSLDRIGWVRSALGGYGLPFGGPLAYGTDFWLADDDYGDASEWLEYNPAKAVALLEEAGYGPGDIKVDLVSTADYGERFASEAEVVHGFLTEIGMDVTLVMQDYNSFLNVYTGDYNGLSWNFSQIGWAPEGWFFREFHSEQGGASQFGLDDAGLDALLDSYTQAVDPSERKRLIRESAKYVVDQAINPLGPFWIYFYGQQNRIKNYQYVHAFDQAYNTSQAWIDEG